MDNGALVLFWVPLDGLLPLNLILCAKIRTYEKDDRYQPAAYSGVLSHFATINLGVDDF